MANIYRDHNCGELRLSDAGKEVRLAGFVQTIRNLGKMVFLDLRDENGITQIVVSDDIDITDVTKECTLTVTGDVVERTSKNDKIPTGEIEVVAKSITVLGKCKNALPFEINVEGQTVREDLRLEYRFLDLRNERIHRNIKLRSKILKDFRNAMDELGFTEVQTPILANSSPEGARDFLVPSRLHPGEFYALPQAPQQFKQLLMVSGVDKYFQIAPCFRDEDARADRSPGEFYQLDMEMAFATQEDVFSVMEEVIYNTFTKFSDKKVAEYPFPRIPYEEAMLKYGSDKPDLRNPLEIKDVTDIFEKIDIKVFTGKIVRTITLPGGASVERSFYDGMTDFAIEECKAKGLAWIKILEDGEWQGPIAKFIDEDSRKAFMEKTGTKVGDSIFFIAEHKGIVEKLAGEIRKEIGKRQGLIDDSVFKFCWIVDFPMYEIADDGKIDFCHNPFSMPQCGMEALLTKDPLDIYAYQYDIVCNGIELSSGAVRNHDPEIMVKAFEIAGYTEEDIKTKFAALYKAFQFGAPPHAGIAPGVDRILMLLSKEDSIREVIAFPMNSKAQDLLMGAPGVVTEKQLREVHIKLDIKK